jgi:hypothetical protein
MVNTNFFSVKKSVAKNAPDWRGARADLIAVHGA